jgi:hypothetical protein
VTGRIPSQLKPVVEKICKCGKKFKTSYSRKIHCSSECANKFNPTRQCENTQRNYKYRWVYGITLEDYNRMFEEQEGCCKICKRHQTEFNKRLHVDHDHKTGKIRGLLCHNCNLALGRLGDSIQTLKSALEYLR